MNAFSRTESLIGTENLDKIKSAKIAVFGVGGVGGFVVEALARSGVQNITVFDNDVVSESNLNRQIIATVGTIGKDKTELVKERVLSINPNARVQTERVFYLPENAANYDLSVYDYIIDAVDTVSAKIEIIMRAKASGVPVISCMGTGGKLDLLSLKVADIEKTKGCPLARVMRRELKSRGISKVKTVFSEETVQSAYECTDKKADGKVAPPSMIFVPAVAGLLIAKEVITDIINKKEEL